jgi:hypothetical protein
MTPMDHSARDQHFTRRPMHRRHDLARLRPVARTVINRRHRRIAASPHRRIAVAEQRSGPRHRLDI